MNGVTKYGYDPLDQLRSLTDPRNLVTGYNSNALGDETRLSSPDSGATNRTFDTAGNLKTATDARGVTATLNYDALNRITQVSYPTAGENVSFTWDAATGCSYGVGRLCQVSDSAGATTYAYDAWGHLIQETRNEAGASYVTSYAYDAADRLSIATTPTGENVSLSRNSAGQVAQITAALGATSTALAQNLQYDGAGQVVSQTLGNGVTQSTRFDLSGQSSGQTTIASPGPQAALDGDVPTLPEWGALLMAGLLLTITYRKKLNPKRLRLLAGLGLTVLLLQGLPFTAWADNATRQYDAAGNIQQRTTPLGATTYTYDALNRLINEAGPAKTQSFSYDPNGNRLSDGLGSYTYPAASNKLQTRRGAAVTTDAAGHITADGSGRNYIYNQAGRLSQVLQGTTLLATYYYNYKGQRTRKVSTSAAPQGAQTLVYHYDLQGHLMAETMGNGNRLRTYVWRDNTPVAQIEYVPSRKILYYDVDHLNTPREARDEAAKVVWRWESDAFGSTAPNEDPDGDGQRVTVNLRFAGQYYDQETALHQNYFRDYDSSTGRYVQSDPIGLEGGSFSTYSYVRGNPLSFIDPEGLETNSACLAACTAVGGAVGTFAGQAAGAAVGGVIGGTAGTAVAPGVGTVVGGAAGAAGGRVVGGRVGGAAGAVAGAVVGQQICSSSTDDCRDQWISDTAWCDNSFIGRKNIACHRWAEEEFERCKKGQPRQPFRL